MRMAWPIAWCPACRWKPGSTPEAASENERACASPRFRLDGADHAIPADFHTVARTPRRAHGHLHIDLKWTIVYLRSCRHTWRGRRRIRRGGLDHHRADRGPNAHHGPGDLDGRGIRTATGLDRRLHRICTHILADPFFAQPAHAVDDAVFGWTGHGVLHTAHFELHIAQHAAQVLGFRHRRVCA